jgi:CRP-like cAMP-binding protein
VPLFAALNNADFMKELSAQLRPQLFDAGQLIVQRGEIGDKMYFLNEARPIFSKRHRGFALH